MERSFNLPEPHYDFVNRTVNPNGYLQHIIEQRMNEYLEARRVLARFSRSQIMAVIELLETSPTPRSISWADRILIGLTASDNVQARWKLDKEAWSALYTLTDDEGAALSFLADEYWAGRTVS